MDINEEGVEMKSSHFLENNLENIRYAHNQSARDLLDRGGLDNVLSPRSTQHLVDVASRGTIVDNLHFPVSDESNKGVDILLYQGVLLFYLSHFLSFNLY
jgi:hypothetical protein